MGLFMQEAAANIIPYSKNNLAKTTQFATLQPLILNSINSEELRLSMLK